VTSQQFWRLCRGSNFSWFLCYYFYLLWLFFIFLKKKEKHNFCLMRYCSFTAVVLFQTDFFVELGICLLFPKQMGQVASSVGKLDVQMNGKLPSRALYPIENVMRSNHQRIHWRFQLVQLLGLGLRSSKKLSMDFLKIHGLRWTSRGFVIIKSKPWLIWVIFKRGLLVELRPLHKDWEKKTRFGQFDLSLLFWS